MTTVQGPAIVYRDNLWFDVEFLEYFMERALQERARLPRRYSRRTTRRFETYTLPLATRLRAGR